MRPAIDEYLMGIAKLAATRTTCIRRGVGCVLADERGHILSVGYNGVASGMPHCNEDTSLGHDGWGHAYACQGDSKEACQAVHAEQNAMLQCKDPDKIATAYVTRSPCLTCLKLLLNAPCRRIVYEDQHSDPAPEALWRKAGRQWQQMS
jgi:dCMP deaminase